MTSSKSSLRLLYLLNQRFPTEKAYGIQVAKMCEAFSKSGCEVELVSPFRISKIKDNPFIFYGLEEVFRFKKIFSPDFYLPGKLDLIAFQIKNFISAVILVIYVLIQKPDIIYSRDELPIYLLSFFKKNLIVEIHKFSNKRTLFYRRFRKKEIKIVAISNGIKNEFEKISFSSSNILVAFDAVDLRNFDINLSRSEARKKLNLPLDKKIAVYSGHLFKWKGVDNLIEAALILKDILFLFVGGTEKDIENYRFLVKDKKTKNVLFLGYRPYREIPLYLKAADVLVLPNKKEEKISELYTSPLKLFEYMASNRPIVASDLPSIREVLNEETAVFFESNQPQLLAEAIKKIIEDENLGRSLSAKAFEKVKNYTWDKRTERILTFLN